MLSGLQYICMRNVIPFPSQWNNHLTSKNYKTKTFKISGSWPKGIKQINKHLFKKISLMSKRTVEVCDFWARTSSSSILGYYRMSTHIEAKGMGAPISCQQRQVASIPPHPHPITSLQVKEINMASQIVGKRGDMSINGVWTTKLIYKKIKIHIWHYIPE